jgi:hypothetical protein
LIGKVITLSKSGPARGGFGEVLAYISRRDSKEPDPAYVALPSSEMGLVNLASDLETEEDLQNIAGAMNATALLSRRFKGNPVYHLSLNWLDDEHPDRTQVEQAVAHVMQALGMETCEAVWAMHRDTDNDHVHLVVNRIHPEKGIVAGPPRFDYLLIDRAMREIELMQGWEHAPGPHVVEYGKTGMPQIVRLSRAERKARGLLHDRSPAESRFHPSNPDVRPEDGVAPAISQRAFRAARNQGVVSFQEWVSGEPARALASLLQHPGASWGSMHSLMADYGLTLQPKGSGMVVTTRLGDRVLAAKASQLGRFASRSALESRLGVYEPSTHAESSTIYKDKGYARFLERHRLQETSMGQGVSSPSPALTTPPRDAATRQVQREARAKARLLLYQRFALEQDTLKVRRKEEREALRTRQRQEWDRFKARGPAERKSYRAMLTQQGVPPRVAAALWSLMRAQEREVLQKRHQAEHRALGHDLPNGQVWRKWLERQASLGDEAAQAALRGLRYREQRKLHRDGIEGEELDGLRPILATFKAEVDRKRQQVRYQNEAGRTLFTDTGPRIEVHVKTQEALEASLRLAAQKFGGVITITGSADFREQATRMAARLGIGLSNPELKATWEAERARSMQKKAPTQSPPKWKNPDQDLER